MIELQLPSYPDDYLIMDKAHTLLNLSYQRTISPDYHGFFQRFYQVFTGAEPRIAEVFSGTDMDRQYTMLMESMTHLISFAQDQKPSQELNAVAIHHGEDKLNIAADIYDVWLESLIQTVRERDPEFNQHVEAAWRKILAPGIAYMKSFCR